MGEEKQHSAGGQGNLPPWKDKRGQSLPDHLLRKKSRRWDAKTWKDYLKSISSPLKERLGLKKDNLEYFSKFEEPSRYATKFRKKFLLTQNRHFYDRPFEEPFEEDPRLELVRQAIEKLTPAEQAVIRWFYWEGRSEYRIARELKKSRSTVQTQKRRAEQKLKAFLSSILPIVEETLPKNRRLLYFEKQKAASLGADSNLPLLIQANSRS